MGGCGEGRCSRTPPYRRPISICNPSLVPKTLSPSQPESPLPPVTAKPYIFSLKHRKGFLTREPRTSQCNADPVALSSWRRRPWAPTLPCIALSGQPLLPSPCMPFWLKQHILEVFSHWPSTKRHRFPSFPVSRVVWLVLLTRALSAPCHCWMTLLVRRD